MRPALLSLLLFLAPLAHADEQSCMLKVNYLRWTLKAHDLGKTRPEANAYALDHFPYNDRVILNMAGSLREKLLNAVYTPEGAGLTPLGIAALEAECRNQK